MTKCQGNALQKLATPILRSAAFVDSSIDSLPRRSPLTTTSLSSSSSDVFLDFGEAVAGGGGGGGGRAFEGAGIVWEIAVISYLEIEISNIYFVK